jgi:hypothetical protein
MQKPAKASVVRQPKKVYCEMIGMGAKSITIVFFIVATNGHCRLKTLAALITLTTIYGVTVGMHTYSRTTRV